MPDECRMDAGLQRARYRGCNSLYFSLLLCQMYDYLATATEPGGRRRTQLVQARTAAHAVARLKESGCTDITLHFDDFAAASVTEDLSKTAPEDLVALKTMRRFGIFVYSLKLLYGATWWLQLIAATYVGYMLVLGDGPSGVLFWIFALILVLPFVATAYFLSIDSSRVYHNMVQASYWGKWAKVLELTPKLRGCVHELDLDIHESIALTRLGRGDEAAERLSKYESDERAPRWMFLSRVAEVHRAAERPDDVIDAFRGALELAPENETIRLDYAIALLREDRDTAAARRLFDAINLEVLSDDLKLLLPYAQGLLALREDRPDDAIASFEESDQATAVYVGINPAIELLRDHAAAFHAIAAARTGNLAAARKLAIPARRRLIATEDNTLLAELNAAVPE